ncbi:MAG: SDR family oxidoreductase [Novosphingobium sp.]|nr:SDR family oxidoreductase [Novosphingobium sp.]
MGWLAGKSARIVGDCPAIAKALEARGARLVADGASDILVHVAAPPAVKPAHELSHDEWRAALDAGLDQRFLLAKEFAIASREAGKGGALLYVGAPEQALGSDHAAAAGALGNLTKTLGVEWARDGIRVNTILTSQVGETLGNLAAYLVSDYAAYVTGAVMGVGLDD